MDFRADEHFAKCLREVCEQWNKPCEFNQLYWKHQTELLLKTRSIKEVCEMVMNVAEGLSDEQFMDGYPIEIFFGNEEDKSTRKNPFAITIESKPRKIINEKLKITEIAKKYGLEVKGNKAVCPFHDDNDPSLSLSDDKNVFFCHGCHAKGDIVTFIDMMEAKKCQEKKQKKKH